MGFKALAYITGKVAGVNEDVRSVGNILDMEGVPSFGDSPGHWVGPGRDAGDIRFIVPPGQFQGKTRKGKRGHGKNP